MQLAFGWPVSCVFKINMISRTVARMRVDTFLLPIASAWWPCTCHQERREQQRCRQQRQQQEYMAYLLFFGACKILECERRGADVARDARWCAP